jgi:hypothetical protein
MPKKNDNRVGSSDGPAVNGGRQTAQQAEITKQESGGRTDTARASATGGKSAGRGNPVLGGSSGGHSDQVASRGPEEDRKVAGGLSFSEQTDGKGNKAQPKHRATD